MSAEQSLQRKERITVIRDGEEVERFNWATVIQPARVRGHNPVVEKFDAEIGAGDSRMKPDAVTHWVAEELDFEFGVDPEEHGIEVIDPTDDDLEVV